MPKRQEAQTRERFLPPVVWASNAARFLPPLSLAPLALGAFLLRYFSTRWRCPRTNRFGTSSASTVPSSSASSTTTSRPRLLRVRHRSSHASTSRHASGTGANAAARRSSAFNRFLRREQARHHHDASSIDLRCAVRGLFLAGRGAGTRHRPVRGPVAARCGGQRS